MVTTRVATNVAELVRRHSDLPEAATVHLQRLVATWGTLSDLCFADLLLFVPMARGVASRPEGFVVVGQVRPTTNATLHLEDLVGRVRSEAERPLVARSWRLGSVVDGEVAIPSRNEAGRVVCIPVRFKGELVAILTRESALSVGRRPGQLERVYMEVFDRLARMVSSGEYPYPMDEVVTTETPRVGDGVFVLDASMRVDYASPNAVNAFHRMGISSGLAGVRLDEVGFDASAVAHAYDQALPTTEEVTNGPEVAVVIRCMPLLDHRSVTGAIVLMRDVSELRRRDRLLLSKDAAIR
ncbi:MAG: histidine kinase N-terminal domain-containing protein, partial [Acidimicrobiales bacterium]